MVSLCRVSLFDFMMGLFCLYIKGLFLYIRAFVSSTFIIGPFVYNRALLPCLYKRALLLQGWLVRPRFSAGTTI